MRFIRKLEEATDTAKNGINTSLAVACAAVVLALLALVVAVIR
jgi:hypothetical protein